MRLGEHWTIGEDPRGNLLLAHDNNPVVAITPKGHVIADGDFFLPALPLDEFLKVGGDIKKSTLWNNN